MLSMKVCVSAAREEGFSLRESELPVPTNPQLPGSRACPSKSLARVGLPFGGQAPVRKAREPMQY